MISSHETFNGTFPFTPRFSTAPGFQMHYVDEGTGTPILCLHGEPTWGYLFREVIPVLAQQHRVVVPDHMGFGKSETPQNREYTLKAHIDNLETLVVDLDLRDITLVMHDFGGPVGAGLTMRHPDRIARLVVTNAFVPFGLPLEQELLPLNIAEAEWFQWIIKSYKDGSFEPVLGNLNYNILSTMKLNGFERLSRVDTTWIQAYGSPFTTPQECLGAIGWARGIAEGTLAFETANDHAVAAILSKPALLIEGMKDPTLLPKYFIPLFEAAFPDGIVHRLENVGHYCYEDASEIIAPLIDQFVQLT
ncbi:alpha/beta fold hydrolase [Leptolyngbya sp. FACHB-261]|uniref:alpha/beta fold hydrolase n=1 Tax=Leptolyngbya sp. FACHB-261 TaxID=2692806 RepID=UPI001688298F|nr:alpha/beta fold hydrolase [Leptolyngbya sp. FACHB-261]MBD2105191.1 alpha/beta fold hydrolase [Leptolyngbya sp. FACHB-261]